MDKCAKSTKKIGKNRQKRVLFLLKIYIDLLKSEDEIVGCDEFLQNH